MHYLELYIVISFVRIEMCVTCGASVCVRARVHVNTREIC